MNFNEKLKSYREEKGLTQAQLAQKSGLTTRMIQMYESGKNKPRFEAAEKLANALDIAVIELLSESNIFLSQAKEKHGPRGAKQAKQLTDEVTGLFAGGEMAEEDLDVMMKAIQDAYWIAKEKNKKYASNNHRNNVTPKK